ncbi:MAG: CoA transferase [Alphaproteobacteria bacterium]|nr:CoA transferase [Alphaproteobacteria bacterium]
MTLARFGAEVIKVEAPGIGDLIRNVGPYAGPKGIHPDRQTDDDLSVRFLKRSEGVKSVTLNLKHPEGRRLFLEMAKQADVVIENLSPGSMRRMGLGYEDVAAVNPGIVYCSIAGYGQTGPYKDLPAHDHQIQAMSGIMDMNGPADGPPTPCWLFRRRPGDAALCRLRDPGGAPGAGQDRPGPVSRRLDGRHAGHPHVHGAGGARGGGAVGAACRQ